MVGIDSVQQNCAACPRSVVDGAIGLYSVSKSFRLLVGWAGLAGLRIIGAHDLDPLVRCLYGVNLRKRSYLAAHS